MRLRLGDVCGNRDNNFNLIRIIAAAAVLIAHAYPLTLGISEADPLRPVIKMTLGFVAVCVFFAISGFLIARSFDRMERLADWFAARLMRLFPALFVVAALTVFVLGPLVTTYSAKEYFSNILIWTYIPRNMTLVFQQLQLPGVFGELPVSGAVNGSLWTLKYEALCYLGVLVLGISGLLRRPLWIAVAFAGYLTLFAATTTPDQIYTFRFLSLPFVFGTVLYCWRDFVPLSWSISGGLGLLSILLHSTPGFEPAFILWLSYSVFVVAYLPGGLIRRYNILGDYSYGLYIYAFPIQQLTVYLFGPMTPFLNMAIAFPVALFCAVLSWRWIEKPSLGMRYKVADLLAGKPGQGAQLSQHQDP